MTGETTESNLPRAVREAVSVGEGEVRRLGELVGELLRRIDRVADELASEASRLDSDLAAPFVELARAARADVDSHLLRQRSVLSTFNIALFGRTGAGKSSLVSALAELDGSRVSRGESDWTVDVEPVPWDGCRLFDTPGINGWGRTQSRTELEATAREAVEVADIVLLCFDSQSQQASEFTKVAEWVHEFGKPTIAVLNNRNLRWRHPAEVPAAARPGLSKAVHQHAGNIRDSLAAVGMPETPIVAIHARHALDARACEPYAGPDPENRRYRRAIFSPEYLYRWSNLPTLEQLLAATVGCGGTDLRLAALRDGIRAILNQWADDVDSVVATTVITRGVLERSVEDALTVLGYPEPDHRAFLGASSGGSDILTRLEKLRRQPFRSPAIGRLEIHVRQLAAAELGILRNRSLKAANKSVRDAFHQRKEINEKAFEAAVFDTKRIEEAAKKISQDAGKFLRRELEMNWEEAATDLDGEARRIRVEGTTGEGSRRVADVMQAGGFLASGASTVLLAIAATNWWNPGGWAAIGMLAVGLVGSIFGWLSGRRRRKAEQKRLAARGNALAAARTAVNDAYNAMEKKLSEEVCREAWNVQTAQFRQLAEQAWVVRRAIDTSTKLAQRIRRCADDIEPAPLAAQVIHDACREVLTARSVTADADRVFLGDDWLEAEDARSVAVSPATLDRLREISNQDCAALVTQLQDRFTGVDAADVDGWLDSLHEAAIEVPGLSPVVQAARAVRHHRCRVVLLGDYSAGKSSMIKRLLAEAGIPAPRDLKVGADPTTEATAGFTWRHLDIVDTPGLQSGRQGHDEAAGTVVAEAGLILVVLHVNLLIGHFRELRRLVIGGDTVNRQRSQRVIFLINRCDELGVDPTADPEEYLRRRARKESELREIVVRQSIAAHPILHTVASDPFGLVGDRPIIGPNDYADRYRAWDGVGALVEALTATEQLIQPITALAAVDNAREGVLACRNRLLSQVAAAANEDAADRSTLAAFAAARGDGLVLSSSLAFRAEALVRTHADRAAATALAAAPEDLAREAERLATWWNDPELQADAADYWDVAAREIKDWQRATRSALLRAVPMMSKGSMSGVRHDADAPGVEEAESWTSARWVSNGAAKFVRAAGDRNVVYDIGKAFGYRFKPWGAVKGAAKVAKVGAVLGFVALTFDVVSWVRRRKAEQRIEESREKVARFVDESVASVVHHLTAATDEHPLSALRRTTADIGDMHNELAQEIAERAVAIEEWQRQVDLMTDLLASAPDINREDADG